MAHVWLFCWKFVGLESGARFMWIKKPFSIQIKNKNASDKPPTNNNSTQPVCKPACKFMVHLKMHKIT